MIYVVLIGVAIFLVIFLKIAEKAGLIGALIITVACVLFVVFFLGPMLEGTVIERTVDNHIYAVYDWLIAHGYLDPTRVYPRVHP